eukprot:13429-Pyramimonas_sp.AAC.1
MSRTARLFRMPLDQVSLRTSMAACSSSPGLSRPRPHPRRPLRLLITPRLGCAPPGFYQKAGAAFRATLLPGAL